jgi:DUF1680 family protein
VTTTKMSVIGGPVQPSTATLRPLGAHEVSVAGGFWGDLKELNAKVILAHCEDWMERIGWIANFDRAAAGTVAANHSGIEFVDSEVYKLLEAMAWELGRASSFDLANRYAALVGRVVAAQEADGYLHTSFGRPGQRARYSDLEWGHELYCFGHLLQAAVARLRTGYDDDLVTAARRLVDHLYREFGPDGRPAVCGHPEIEPALVEFGRATGSAQAVELARLFVERRGTGTLATIEWGQEYFQDDMPVREATVLRGHAVRALYLASGALDVATEANDLELVSAVEEQWANTVAKRTYITGGMGSHHQDEAFGADYELPSDRAYSETCAGIASVMLSWRLLLRTGESKYADLMERTLLNNILASPRADGHGFFYTNTLHQRTVSTVPDEDRVNVRALSTLRAPWFEVSCCPTNVARTLASLELYFATATRDAVQIHQFGDIDIRTTLADAGEVALSVRSRYPHDGNIRVEVLEAPGREFGIELRIPAWAADGAAMTLNGVEVPSVGVLRFPFTAGDVVVLDLPMEPRFSYPDARIDAIRGTVAVERGPLVQCVEDVDLPNGYTVNDITLETSQGLRVDAGGRVVARARLRYSANLAWPYTDHNGSQFAGSIDVPLVPYFIWGNRGPATMRVWTPTADPSHGTAVNLQGKEA